MLKAVFITLLSFLLPFNSGSFNLFSGIDQEQHVDSHTGSIEKMIVANGDISMNIDMDLLSGKSSNQAVRTELRFNAVRDSFFTVMVFNNELRGPLPSSMEIKPENSAAVPAKLGESYQNLIIETTPFGEAYELVVRDGKTGFIFFNIEGHLFDYQPDGKVFSVREGRMLISKEFATALGRPADSGKIVGELSLTANMRTIEIAKVVDGEVVADTLPATPNPESGSRPGPDVIVGDIIGLAQFGSSSGTQVGLAIGTTSCNFGTVDLNWFALPANDHPVIPQNLYRMSGGAQNNDRFEQIGQSSVKHAFTALTQNICSLGCNGVGGSRLGSGCSDPYTASLNSGPNLGSRAWINPFSGAFPRGDSATNPNNHNGHTHLGPTHRVLTEISDLVPNQNPGATYYAEGQYVTPHEYTHCQANPTECNMYNNISYRRYTVSGTGSPFSFSPAESTVREKTALNAWEGATIVEIRPDPGNDGIGSVGYKVTNPSAGVWHYEYAVHNINLDRAISMFSVPTGAGVTVSNVGFYAPPQHPGSSADGSSGDAGFSNTAWSSSQASGALTWNTQTIAQNANANAIRWGTMYNFRFDSNRPPAPINATVGFFKTGAPITAPIQGPSAAAAPVKSRADFDGDGKTDVSVYRPSEGNWYLSRSTAGFGVINFGISTDKPIPGDYDGDGKADTAVFRASATPGVADYYILNSNGFTVTSVEWGTTGDIPVSGDYNGDGKTDIAVWRSSNNIWYVLNSGGGPTVESFGLAGDVPLAIDPDGDGKTNFAVFRPSNNTWYIARPSGVPATNFDSYPFGATGDMPVPADYDNDNKDDIAMFRPSNGTWYILRSTNGTYQFTQFGASGDVPVPGDYDGDGADDIAVYRAGVWYAFRSTAGVSIQGFGLGSDLPVPKQYIP